MTHTCIVKHIEDENVKFAIEVANWVDRCLNSLPDRFYQSSSDVIFYLPWILRKGLADYCMPGQEYNDEGILTYKGLKITAGYENALVALIMREEFEKGSVVRFKFDYKNLENPKPIIVNTL